MTQDDKVLFIYQTWLLTVGMSSLSASLLSHRFAEVNHVNRPVIAVQILSVVPGGFGGVLGSIAGEDHERIAQAQSALNIMKCPHKCQTN